MIKRSRLVAILMIISIIISIFPLRSYADVSDISDYWGKEVIVQWLEKGLANGYPDGTFRPKNGITRAEFISLVNGAFGYTAEEEIEYKDLTQGKWYITSIKRAKAAGYISGYNDGTMRPDSTITREEVATIIGRITKLNPYAEGIEGFIDKENIKWSKGYVGAVASAKYMVGFPDGSFKPQNNITRGEAIYALNNIIMGKEEVKGVQALAKQDFLGITYIRVLWNKGIKPSAVKANGRDLTYDNSDGRWKGTALDWNIGDEVVIQAISNGSEEKMVILVKDILDN